MTDTIETLAEKFKRHGPEIALAGLFVYVAVLAVATLSELGII